MYLTKKSCSAVVQCGFAISFGQQVLVTQEYTSVYWYTIKLVVVALWNKNRVYFPYNNCTHNYTYIIRCTYINNVHISDRSKNRGGQGQGGPGPPTLPELGRCQLRCSIIKRRKHAEWKDCFFWHFRMIILYLFWTHYYIQLECILLQCVWILRVIIMISSCSELISL